MTLARSQQTSESTFGRPGMRWTPSRAFLAGAVVVAGAAFPANSLAALIIDGFDSDQQIVDASADGSEAISTQGDAAVIGGFRKFVVNKTDPAASVLINVTNTSDAGTSMFLFEQGSTTGRGVGSIIYDGGSAGSTVDPTGLGGVDLTDGGTLTDFAFINMDVVGPGLVLTINLYDFTTSLASTYSQLLPNGFSGDLLIPYASFSNPATAMNVGAIEIIIDGTINASADGSDVSFDLLSSTSVPEPAFASLVLLCGLLPLGMRPRRRADAHRA